MKRESSWKAVEVLSDVGRHFHASALVLGLALVSFVPSAAKAEVSVGGWAGFVFSDNDKDGSKWTFDAHPWYFYVQAEPVESWKFFGEIEAEHVFQFQGGEGGKGELKLERLYLEKSYSSTHNFRLGKFFLPFGYWSNLHWHFLTETYSRPFSFNNKYTSPMQVGMQYFGRLFAGNTQLNYYAWLGNGPDLFGTDERTVEKPGFGGSLFVTHLIGGREDMSIGGVLGFHAETRQLGDEENPKERDTTGVVAGLEAKVKIVEVRGEYFQHDLDEGKKPVSWYANALVWGLPRLGVNYRLDMGEDFKRTKKAEDHDVTSHSVGLVWRPHAQVLVKSEYRINQFNDDSVKDFNEWNAFMALKY